MFFSLARRRDVVTRAAKTALVVGFVLVTINHGDVILEGDVSAQRWLQMMLTFAVPYCVSTYASVGALRGMAAAPVAADDHEES